MMLQLVLEMGQLLEADATLVTLQVSVQVGKESHVLLHVHAVSLRDVVPEGRVALGGELGDGTQLARERALI